jgi:Zn-dependent protease
VFGLNIDPAAIIAVAVMLLVGFPVHEFSHALAAYRLGDGTAKMFGRLTLNPIVHFDPLGGLLLVFSALSTGFFFGWAKPTPVNPMNLQGGRRGEAIVALAGPASNLVMAAAAAIPLRFIVGSDMAVPQLVVEVLSFFVLINIFLAVFNLIPIPPLDGYRVLLGLIDPRLAWQIRPMLEQYGFIILLVFLFTVGGRIVSGIGFEIFGFLVGR